MNAQLPPCPAVPPLQGGGTRDKSRGIAGQPSGTAAGQAGQPSAISLANKVLERRRLAAAMRDDGGTEGGKALSHEGQKIGGGGTVTPGAFLAPPPVDSSAPTRAPETPPALAFHPTEHEAPSWSELMAADADVQKCVSCERRRWFERWCDAHPRAGAHDANPPRRCIRPDRQATP